MDNRAQCDAIDVTLLRVLINDARAATVTVAEEARVARNTVHTRYKRWDDTGVLHTFERRINTSALGFALRAYVFTRVEQRSLAAVSQALHDIAEVVGVDGLSGHDDLLVHVVARDADDLYRIAGQILDIDGVERTRTSLVMRELIEHRVAQLLPPAD
jgi:DNA-binding Lrp family transcriptional regulator